MAAAPVHCEAVLLDRREPAQGYLELELECPSIARAAGPGQFVMVRAWPGSDPYLPRPFDILSTDPSRGTLRLFVKVEGRGTALLRGLAPGAAATLTGPLGRAVSLGEPAALALLVRGAGAAAVVYLAQEAARRGAEVYTVLSASTASRLVCREYLQAASRELVLATDDASAGHGGPAVALLDGLLERRAIRQVYTCGSRRFARHVQELDRRGRVRGFVFLEGLMACGLGDCHGCAVRRADGAGYSLVCRDGPHFPAAEVVIE